MSHDDDVRWALHCARHLRGLGLAVLPSISTDKMPPFRYAHHYEGEAIPDRLFTPENWEWTNLQVMTGNSHPGSRSVVAIDLDGPPAIDAWANLCRKHDHKASGSWVCRTGSGGLHIWYGLGDRETPCRTGRIWGLWDTAGGKESRGGWTSHTEIKVIADRALIMAPPGIHPETKKRYRFLTGRGPDDIEFPDPPPEWALMMPRLTSLVDASERRERPTLIIPKYSREEVMRRYKGFPDRDHIKSRIPDLLMLAKSWGLETVHNQPNREGWVQCYVPWRESKGLSDTPSGSFHVETGVTQDMAYKDNVMPFFQLGSTLQSGHFRTWKDCLIWCAHQYDT